jgi:hypothetical protein
LSGEVAIDPSNSCRVATRIHPFVSRLNLGALTNYAAAAFNFFWKFNKRLKSKKGLAPYGGCGGALRLWLRLAPVDCSQSHSL